MVLATTPREVFASSDAGESWQRLEVMQQFPHAYTRGHCREGRWIRT